MYALLGDAVVCLHFLWVLFILSGIILARRFAVFSILHLTGLIFTLFLNLTGWFCPLTYLENYMYSLQNPGLAYSGSFLSRYLQQIIYLDVPEVYLRIGAIVWVGMNVGGYLLIFKKRNSLGLTNLS